MKRVLLVLSCLVWMINVWGEGAELKTPNIVDATFEKVYDEPFGDIIFEDAEITVKQAKLKGWKNFGNRNDDESIKLPYPKVIFEMDSKDINFRKNEQQIKNLKFYNSEGNIIKKIELNRNKFEKVSKSHNGKYITIWRRPTEDNPENSGVALYKDDGTLIWSIDQDVSLKSVSDSGYVIASELEFNPLKSFIFYNPQGKEINRVINPYQNLNESLGYASFTRSNEYALLGYTDNVSKTIIFLTTKEGQVLWQKEIDYVSWIPTKGTDFEENVGIVGVGFSKKSNYEIMLYFIDWYGNLIWTISMERRGEIIVKISQNKENIYIVNSCGYLWNIGMKSGKVIFKHKEDWTDTIFSLSERYDTKLLPYFSEMKLGNKYVYIIGKYMKWAGEDAGLWRSSLLYVFDLEKGNLIQKIEYPDKRISLTKHNNKIFIIDMDTKKISSIKIVGEKK